MSVASAKWGSAGLVDVAGVSCWFCSGALDGGWWLRRGWLVVEQVVAEIRVVVQVIAWSFEAVAAAISVSMYKMRPC